MKISWRARSRRHRGDGWCGIYGSQNATRALKTVMLNALQGCAGSSVTDRWTRLIGPTESGVAGSRKLGSPMADLGAADKLKLFISYSRRDLAFADWLVAALKARGLEVRIDRQDLPKLEDWERELLDFIRQADTVVFIASPHSLASKV